MLTYGARRVSFLREAIPEVPSCVISLMEEIVWMDTLLPAMQPGQIGLEFPKAIWGAAGF